MEKIIIYIILIFVLHNCIYAQNGSTIDSVDIKTYNLYMKKQWKEVISEGINANENGINFYYLKLRMGIAYYETNNYKKASKYLKDALIEVPDYKYAKTLLYKSYLLSGNNDEARLLESDIIDKKIEKKTTSFFKDIYVGGGMVLNNNNRNDINSITTDINNMMVRSSYQDQSYISVSGKSFINKRWTLYLSYMTMKMNKFSQYKLDKLNEIENTISQKQYYSKLNFYAGKGISFKIAAHLLNVDYDETDISFNTEIVDSINMVEQTVPLAVSYQNSMNNYILHFGIKKTFSLTNVSLNLGYGNLNKAQQIKSDISLTYFPFGNLNTYSITNIIYHRNKNYWDNNTTNKFIINQKLGQKIFSKLWLEASFSYGDMDNYFENDGSSVYNSVYTIKEQFGIGAIMPFTNFNLFLDYKHINIQDSQTLNINSIDNSISTKSTTFTYSNQLITGGIKWKF